MGCACSSPPAAPTPANPTAVSSAQGSADINTAIAQANLNNVNQVTPYGNLTYSQNGSQTVTLPDGSTVQVPQFTATQTLTPTGQQTVDQQQQTQLGLATLANQQTGRVSSVLGNQLSFAGEPSMVTGLNKSAIPSVPTGVNNSELDLGAIPMGVDLSQVNALPQTINANAQVQNSIDISSLGLLPTGVNASALPNQVSGLNFGAIPGVPMGGPQQTENAEAGALYGESMGFLQPQFQQQQTNLQDQLAQQGIPVGSQAYENAMAQLSTSQNQQQSAALDNAVATGAAQGGTNYGLSLQGTQTAVGEQTANAALAQQAAQTGLSEQQLNAQIAQGAVGQDIGAQTANAGVANQAAQTQLAQQMARAQQADTAAQIALQGQQLNANQALAANQFLLSDQAQNAQIAQGAASQATQQQILSAQLAQAARQQGISEQQYLYNLPLNQTTALLSGSQVQGPSFVNTPQTQVQSPNVLGAYALQQQGQQANYQSQMQNYAAGLGGMFGLAGAGLSAYGNYAGLAALGSSRTFKTDNAPIDKFDVLEKVSRMPVERWRYKPGMFDGGEHIGPYAEDFARELGGDGQHIDVITMLGALTASVQALTALVKQQNQRIEVLEAG